MWNCAVSLFGAHEALNWSCSCYRCSATLVDHAPGFLQQWRLHSNEILCWQFSYSETGKCDRGFISYVMSPCLENSFKMQEIMSSMKYWIEHFPHVRISFQGPQLHSEIRWSLYLRESLLYILCLSEKAPRLESSSTDATWYLVQTKEELQHSDTQFRVSSREIRNFPLLSTEYLNEYISVCILLLYKLQNKPHHMHSISKRLIYSPGPAEAK